MACAAPANFAPPAFDCETILLAPSSQECECPLSAQLAEQRECSQGCQPRRQNNCVTQIIEIPPACRYCDRARRIRPSHQTDHRRNEIRESERSVCERRQ